MGFKKGPKHDYTGLRFGYLEVIGMSPKPADKRREYQAICKCHNCGKENCRIFTINLRKGRAKSCGCLKGYRIKGKDRKNYKGHEGITGSIWGRIKQGAIKRGLDFTITIIEAWTLFEQQEGKCALTGLPIAIGEGRFMGTASLDRKDSSRGYLLDNIQWVHRNVNIIKHSCSQEYFITLCRKISANPNLLDIKDLTDHEISTYELFTAKQDHTRTKVDLCQSKRL